MEPFDVSAFFAIANAQYAHQLSIIRPAAAASVLTYSAHMGGQSPLYATIVSEQGDEDEAHKSRLEWEDLMTCVAARTIKAVDEEDESCCEAAPVEDEPEERVEPSFKSGIENAASLHFSDLYEPGSSSYSSDGETAPNNDNNEQQQKPLGGSAFFANVQPSSSLGASSSASYQARTEDRLPQEKMERGAGAGDAAQKKKRPVLLRLVRVLGRAFMHCLKPSGVCY
ncbi:hypothetical protein FOA52_011357 [Chlamydomonas sp. UWO 241]|nr:hypothetical protein FOA52_011357 [Chlamydomonas sp. UWO 241]